MTRWFRPLICWLIGHGVVWARKGENWGDDHYYQCLRCGRRFSRREICKYLDQMNPRI